MKRAATHTYYCMRLRLYVSEVPADQLSYLHCDLEGHLSNGVERRIKPSLSQVLLCDHVGNRLRETGKDSQLNYFEVNIIKIKFVSGEKSKHLHDYYVRSKERDITALKVKINASKNLVFQIKFSSNNATYTQ